MHNENRRMTFAERQAAWAASIAAAPAWKQALLKVEAALDAGDVVDLSDAIEAFLAVDGVKTNEHQIDQLRGTLHYGSAARRAARGEIVENKVGSL